MHPNYLRYLNISLQKTTTVFLDTAQLWYFLLTQTPTETTNDHHPFVVSKRCPAAKKNGTSLSFLSTKGWARNNSSWAAWVPRWHCSHWNKRPPRSPGFQTSLALPSRLLKVSSKGAKISWDPPAVGHEAFTICYIVCTYPYNHIFSLHTSLVCVFEICNPSPFQLNFYKMHPPHTSQGKRGMPPTWPSHQGMTHRWTCWFVGMARMPASGYASM